MKTATQNIISAAKGSFQSVTWKSNPTPAACHKKAGIALEKITTAVCKAGIDFAKLSTVKEGISSGERGEVESLPWGEWEIFPFTIQHKGERYIRLYPASQKNQSKTIYKVNGGEVSKDIFLGYLTPSEQAKMQSGEKPLCFTVKESNLID